jgi:hypothetical protein
MMHHLSLLTAIVFMIMSWGCKPQQLPRVSRAKQDLTATQSWLTRLTPLPSQARDSMIVEALKKGEMPKLLQQWKRITVEATGANGRRLRLQYWVTPDYLALGTDHDFFRLPLTRAGADSIAAFYQCILPTRKMVNDIYLHASVICDPIPMYALRDSLPTFYHHHLMIEGQRQGRKGLIAGIKKDIVQADSMNLSPYLQKIAIYGWHRRNALPIQPLYKKHSARYVDYSHGVRLVFRKMKLNGQWLDWQELIQNPDTRFLVWDEPSFTFSPASKQP